MTVPDTALPTPAPPPARAHEPTATFTARPRVASFLTEGGERALTFKLALHDGAWRIRVSTTGRRMDDDVEVCWLPCMHAEDAGRCLTEYARVAKERNRAGSATGGRAE